MLECVVIAKDLAYRGRVNAATIENDAWCVEKQGVFSVIRDGDLDIYKILRMELENGERYIIGIDQSTQGTKALLFDGEGHLLRRTDLPHRQIVNERDGCPMI